VRAYKPGQSIRFSATVTLVDVLTDPPALVLTLKGPSGAPITPAPVNDSTGQYHADAVLPLDAPDGQWTARWQATGPDPTANALVETRFVVQPLNF